MQHVPQSIAAHSLGIHLRVKCHGSSQWRRGHSIASEPLALPFKSGSFEL